MCCRWVACACEAITPVLGYLPTLKQSSIGQFCLCLHLFQIYVLKPKWCDEMMREELSRMRFSAFLGGRRGQMSPLSLSEDTVIRCHPWTRRQALISFQVCWYNDTLAISSSSFLIFFLLFLPLVLFSSFSSFSASSSSSSWYCWYYFVLAMLGVEPRNSYMLSNHSTSAICPQFSMGLLNLQDCQK